MGVLLKKGETHVGVVPLDLRQWVEFYPQTAASPLLSELVREAVRWVEQQTGT